MLLILFIFFNYTKLTNTKVELIVYNYNEYIVKYNYVMLIKI